MILKEKNRTAPCNRDYRAIPVTLFRGDQQAPMPLWPGQQGPEAFPCPGSADIKGLPYPVHVIKLLPREHLHLLEQAFPFINNF